MRVNTNVPNMTDEWARADKYIDEWVSSTTRGIEGLVVSAWPATGRKVGLLVRDAYASYHQTDSEHATIVRERT